MNGRGYLLPCKDFQKQIAATREFWHAGLKAREDAHASVSFQRQDNPSLHEKEFRQGVQEEQENLKTQRNRLLPN
jgi:hypothetical protein